MSSTNNTWTSWNGNISHSFEKIVVPTSIDQISEAVASADALRAFGTGQSSSDICAGTTSVLDMRNFSEITAVDHEKKTITAQSGILLSKLLEYGLSLGWIIPCLPDNDSITLGGAIATGTHGTTGDGQILSSYMVACTLITPNGEVRQVSAEDPFMDALRVSVGLFGVFGEITVQFEAAKNIHLTERPIREDEWLETWPQLLKDHYFVRILSLPHTGYGYVITGDVIENEKHTPSSTAPFWIGQRREVSKMLYRSTYPPAVRVANRILKSLFFSHTEIHDGDMYTATVTKSRGSTLELAEWTADQKNFNESFIDFRDALKADKKAFAHIPMDVRFVNSDESWLSYAYQRDIVTVGCVTRNPAKADSYRAFGIQEDAFLQHGGRPHWAKRFKATSEDLAKLYPKWNDFLALRREMDPKGKFLNGYLREIFE